MSLERQLEWNMNETRMKYMLQIDLWGGWINLTNAVYFCVLRWKKFNLKNAVQNMKFFTQWNKIVLEKKREIIFLCQGFSCGKRRFLLFLRLVLSMTFIAFFMWFHLGFAFRRGFFLKFSTLYASADVANICECFNFNNNNNKKLPVAVKHEWPLVSNSRN